MRKHNAQGLAILGTAIGTMFGGAAQAAAEAADPPELGDPIVITGERVPDPLLEDVQPIDELDQRDVAAHGVNSIAELLADLARELAAGGDSAPLVLLNGRRIAGLGEVADLPTESIRRVEVLPAPAALRFGGNASQRTINFVLRRQFRSASVNAGGGLATEGGGRNGDMAANLTRVFGDNRLSLGARASTGRRLLESERDIAQPSGAASEGRFRTLRPEVRRYSLNGSLARQVSEDVNLSVNASGNYETSHGLIGLPLSDGGDLGDPLRNNVRTIGGYLGLKANAEAGRWSLSGTADYGHRVTNTLSEHPLDALAAPSLSGDRIDERSRSRSSSGGLTFVASGALLDLPAGPLRTSLYTDVTRATIVARRSRAGVTNEGERDRTDAGAWLTAELPITSRDSSGLFAGLSANLRGGLRSVSDIGTLRSYSYGLTWAPARAFSLTASMKTDRQPPSLGQLASPTIETSGTRVFDYVRGETVELTEITGGNPDLDADRRRTFTVGFSVLPFGPGKLRVSAEYKSAKVDDPVAALPAATADIQAAFPERFVRDAGGVLVSVDSRLVNFERQDLKQLHWGFAWRRTSGGNGAAKASNGTSDEANGDDDASHPGLALRLVFDHTLVLKSELLPRRGLPEIDLLHGGALGAYGGQPRHLLQWELGATKGGLGARLLGSWRSATTVRGSFDADTGRLRFSPLMQHELRLFADLDGRFPRFAWARGSRLTLTISNLLNQRQKVRDSNEQTPLIYQPDYLDPLGRTVRLSFRKMLN